MYPFVITIYNALSNDEFKSKPGVSSSLSAVRMDSTTPVPERTSISQSFHHERALSSSSNGSQTLATQPNPERPARSVPWMEGSKEYQPQQAPTQDPEFTEEWLGEGLEGSRCSCGGHSFWHICCSCTPFGIGPVCCCTYI